MSSPVAANENALASDIAREHVAIYIVSNASSMMTDLFHKKIKKEFKSANDYVTELDKAIESMATKSVLQLFPEDGFYGEENMAIESTNGYVWVVDPIDGTNNYVRGLSLCGVQLAIVKNGITLFSVISRPFTQDLFIARIGKGAFYRNILTGEESKVRVSERELKNSLVIFDASVGKKENFSTNILYKLADSIATVRVLGVAVYDLPAIASGVAEILITGIANPYDIAPGLLLIQEAGGEVYDINGVRPNIESKFMIFSTPTVKKELLTIINKEKNNE